MRRGIFAVATLVIASLALCSVATAATISAQTTLPPATGLSVAVSRVQGTTWTPVATGDPINFGPLTLYSGTVGGKAWSVFLPDYYYVLDIALTGGGFDPTKSVNIGFTPGSTPSGAVGNLGDRATITYCKTVLTNWNTNTTTDTILTALGDGGKKLLKTAQIVPLTQVSGGWLRLYVGICALDPAAVPADPAGAMIFSPADPTGDYTGSISVTLS